MKRLLLALLLISFSAAAQNPPLPCGVTWQQGGVLYRGELYQGAFPLPKQPQDFWIFTNTRPGYNFSYGWYKLECGRPVELPLDDWMPTLVVVSGIVGFVFINRKLRKNIK